VGTLLEATKFGRQNPLCARWNSPEQLLNWREAWASAVNRALEEKQQSARVTHLSHAALGLDEQPTAHEGSQARKLEMQGIQIKKRSKPTNKNGSGRKEQKEGQASHHTSDKAVLKPFGLLWLNVML
jgi:hypothetical protein